MEKEVKMPVCEKCKHEFVFELDAPFAHCNCGTTEWGNDGDIYREIQKGRNTK